MARDSEGVDPKLLQEWLDAGNKITVYPAGARTDPEDMQYKTKWGRPKAKKETKK
jgi:hypothetical protein|tara:strand:- start:1862 stop:2026 length:165 start_codon:yes stop_codon:yes gene_type:complete